MGLGMVLLGWVFGTWLVSHDARNAGGLAEGLAPRGEEQSVTHGREGAVRQYLVAYSQPRTKAHESGRVTPVGCAKGYVAIEVERDGRVVRGTSDVHQWGRGTPEVAAWCVKKAGE